MSTRSPSNCGGRQDAHGGVCQELNRLGYRTRTGKPCGHPQQIIKLLRSFGGED